MKYMLLIYGAPAIWDAMSEQERDEVLRLHAALVEELSESGELIAGAGLADPESTMTVRGTSPMAADGPLEKAGAQMSAFYLIDCTTAGRAHEIANRILDPHVPAVEVRPVHSVESG